MVKSRLLLVVKCIVVYWSRNILIWHAIFKIRWFIFILFFGVVFNGFEVLLLVMVSAHSKSMREFPFWVVYDHFISVSCSKKTYVFYEMQGSNCEILWWAGDHGLSNSIKTVSIPKHSSALKRQRNGQRDETPWFVAYASAGVYRLHFISNS